MNFCDPKDIQAGIPKTKTRYFWEASAGEAGCQGDERGGFFERLRFQELIDG